MDKGEIILYRSQNDDVTIDVLVESETVWLTQAQMAELFGTSRNNITMHVRNVFTEGELIEKAVCKDFLHTAADGKHYKTKHYNLDAIISVGYRVKSQRGVQFRIWATQVLKNYILRGYAFSHRIDHLESQMTETVNRVAETEKKAVSIGLDAA
jgi:hypothetical protein